MEKEDQAFNYSSENSSDLIREELIQPNKKMKILVLGGANTGKTSLITRLKEDIFLDYYESTLQSTTKVNIVQNKELIELEVIDLDGQTEFSILTYNKFAKGINGYVLVYSTTDRKSFFLVDNLNQKLNDLVGSKVPRVLIGNKKDLDERAVSPKEGQELANKINSPFIECSAYEENDKNNVEKAFRLLIAETYKLEYNFDESRVNNIGFFKCFISNLKLFKTLFIIFTFFNLSSDICLFYFSFDFQVYFFLILTYSLWTGIFCVLGIISVVKESGMFFRFNFIGQITTILIIFGIYITRCVIAKVQNDKTGVFSISDKDGRIYNLFLPGRLVIEVISLIYFYATSKIYTSNLLYFYL